MAPPPAIRIVVTCYRRSEVIHMAYATVTHSPATTLREFQAVNAALGDEQPEGRLLLLVGHSADGLHIIDVWATQAHADRFVAERLYPALQRVGLMPQERDFHVEFEVTQLHVAPAAAAPSNVTGSLSPPEASPDAT
jgi:hypothetical protein